MESSKIFEIDVRNNTEKKYRVFIERHYDKIHHSGGISDDPYDEIVHYDIEITSGEKVKEYVYNPEHRYDSYDEPANAMRGTYEDFLNRYYSGVSWEKEALKPSAFADLIEKTKKGIPLWKPFLCYDKANYVNPREVSKYLKEIEKSGEKEKYTEYVKSLVIDFQKEYIDKLSPYYKQILCKEDTEQSQRAEEQSAMSYILGFKKK